MAEPGSERFCVPGTGVGSMYLCNLQAEVPHIDRHEEVEAKPQFESMQALREAYKDDKTTEGRLVNKVKKCANCGKPCAISLTDCNACGASLEHVEVSHTDNIFTGFMLGVKAGNFPFRISIRHQSPEFLVFDDPLALSPCHLLAINTKVYCPDCRYLFTNPSAGLKLLEDLFNVTVEVAMKQFWTNEDFRKKILMNEKPPTSVEEVQSLAMAGLNCPPSQYQLHLQFIHAPMLPFHFAQALDYNHYHYGRFFPYEYLCAALALGDQARLDVTETTSMEEIMAHTGKLGVHYDKYQADLQKRFRDLQKRFGCWKEDEFAGVVVNGKYKGSGEEGDPKKIQAEDTKKIQNYGRPYDQNGKPSGAYYKYPKLPEHISDFRDLLA